MADQQNAGAHGWLDDEGSLGVGRVESSSPHPAAQRYVHEPHVTRPLLKSANPGMRDDGALSAYNDPPREERPFHGKCSSAI